MMSKKNTLPDIKRLKVDGLKNVLKERGVPSSNKRKSELLELAEKAVKVYTPLEACDHAASEHKRRKVTTLDGKEVDLYNRKVNWTTNIKDLPNITLSHVFRYCVRHCEWTTERLCTYTADDGYKMFLSGHVIRVEIGLISSHSEHIYVKGSIIPEQRQGDDRYNTWILISKRSFIVSAGCECTAA